MFIYSIDSNINHLQMATEVISLFQSELTTAGKLTFDGPIGQEYQDFVDYWVDTVCRNLHSSVTEKDNPQSTTLVQQFFQEQLANGKYTLETPIGREYQG